jgi:Terpene cyclase DEP1
MTRFVSDLWATPASRSITVDLICITLALAVWMISESRRLSMRHTWLYLCLAVFVAVSVARLRVLILAPFLCEC